MFLGDEWLTAMDTAARALTTPADLVVEQVVRDVPGRGDVRFHIAFGVAGARVRPGAAARADVRLSAGYTTAVALARGETNAQEALARGEMQLVGDVNTLVEHADAFTTIGDVFAGVRSATEYEHVG